MRKFKFLSIPLFAVLLAVTTMLSGCLSNIFENGGDNTELSNKPVENIDSAAVDTNINSIISATDSIRESPSYKASDLNSQKNIMMNEIQKMADNGLVKSDSIAYDEDSNIISYISQSKVMFFEKVGGFDDNLDGGGTVVSSDPNSLYFKGKGANKADCLILDGMTNRTEVTEKCKALAEEWSAEGIYTTLDLDVTIDDLTNLKEYEFVYFKTHGIYDKSKKLPVISLEQKPTKDVNIKYAEDLSNDFVVCINGHYGVTPDFFSTHYKYPELKNSIFFFGCCQLMGAGEDYTDLMNYAFAVTGLRCFVAHFNSNYTDYNLATVEVFLNELISGKTARQAFETALDTCGRTDEEWYGSPYPGHVPAYPLLKGNEESVFQWEYGIFNDDICYIDALKDFKTQYDFHYPELHSGYEYDTYDLRETYYCLIDLNGDGINEMVVSAYGNDDNGGNYGYTDALYTRDQNGYIELFFDAGKQKTYGITSDGYIYNKYKFVYMYTVENSELKLVYELDFNWDYDDGDDNTWGDSYIDLDNRDKAERAKRGISEEDMTFNYIRYEY